MAGSRYKPLAGRGYVGWMHGITTVALGGISQAGIRCCANSHSHFVMDFLLFFMSWQCVASYCPCLAHMCKS